MGKKMPRLPDELRNAREWNPTLRGQPGYESSSESASGSESDALEWAEPGLSSASDNCDEDLKMPEDLLIDLSIAQPPSKESDDAGENFIEVQSSRSKRHKMEASNRDATGSNWTRLGRDRRRNMKAGKKQSKPKGRIFPFIRDNPGQAAYRRRHRPAGSYKLYKDHQAIEPDFSVLCTNLEEIATRAGSFILPPRQAQDRTLHIWGNSRQVQRTKDLLQEWLRQRDEGPPDISGVRRKKYAWELSSDTARYAIAQKDIVREYIARKFQQLPDPSKSFGGTAAFSWPVDEVRPASIFGRNTEAFDALRRRNKCHIVFNDQKSSFEVYADDPAVIGPTFERLQGALNAFRLMREANVVEYFVILPSPDKFRSNIKFLDHRSASIGKFPGKLAKLPNTKAEPSLQTIWAATRDDRQSEMEHQLSHAILQVLPRLRYTQGRVDLRVHFGIFQFLNYAFVEEGEVIAIDRFLKEIKAPGTKGGLLRCIGPSTKPERLLHKIEMAKQFLIAPSTGDDLESVLPVITGRFDILRPETEKPSVRLEIEFGQIKTPGAKDHFERKFTMWSRQDGRDMQRPLETYMADIEGNCSWLLRSSREHKLDHSRIDPMMKVFEDYLRTLKLDRRDSLLTGRNAFDFSQLPTWSLKPSMFEQKTTLQYRLAQDPNWIFEISRYDTYQPYDDKIPNMTNWGVMVWHQSWDEILAENSTLAIGQRASWEPKLTTFFPSSTDTTQDDGFLEFLQLMEKVQVFVSNLPRC